MFVKLPKLESKSPYLSETLRKQFFIEIYFSIVLRNGLQSIQLVELPDNFLLKKWESYNI